MEGSLQIINVSDSLHPTLVSDFPTTKTAGLGVSYYKDLAYFLTNKGIYIIDPKNPNKPQIVGTYLSDKSQYGFGISVVADFAFLAHKTKGLEIVDVSDPSSPTLVSTTMFPGNVSDIEIHFNQGLAYIGSRDAGLYIFGFSSIPNPVYIKNLILGMEVPASVTVLDINKDFKMDISDMTTILNPELDPVSEP
jgi:hypothetical protein